MRILVAVSLLTVASAAMQSAASCPDAWMVPLPPPANSNASLNATVLTCVDRVEASVEIFGRRHPFNRPVAADSSSSIRAVSSASYDPSVRPQAYISQAQATAACANAGKRLCTLSEYMLGCGGPSGLTYPYGNDLVPGKCNTGHPNPVLELFGPHATFNWTEMNDPRLDLLPNTLAPGGNFTACTNDATGTYDMSGNLDEWVETLDAATGHGIFKGGYFVDSIINGPGCRYETTAHATWYHDYSLGFRCCSGPRFVSASDLADPRFRHAL